MDMGTIVIHRKLIGIIVVQSIVTCSISIFVILQCICTQEPLQVTVGHTMSPKNGVFLRIASHDL